MDAGGPRSSPGKPCRPMPGICPGRRTVPHQLRHRSEDSLEIDLVIIATFSIECIGVDLTCEKEDRDRVGPAFGDSRQRVGRAGPAVVHTTPGRPETRA